MRSNKEDFIGWTSEDGNLEVIGIAGKGKDGKALYKIACKICSEDKELFPTGYFISNKSNLIYNNQCPCGCSFSHKWNKEQYLILARRSFNIDSRVVALRHVSGCKNIEIIRAYKARHGDIFKIEQEIHAELRAKGFEHRESTWSTETFNNNCLHELEEILQRYKNTLEEV